ncbi:MAG: ABC transporter permease [Syntrophomonadaceae bacterium]|nr:ABC transporter permease [Syntrophomonadaceae bacterium]
MSAQRNAGPWLLLAAACGLFAAAAHAPGLWAWLLGLLLPGEHVLLYPRAPLPVLLGEHLRLVGLSSSLAAAVGIPLGIAVTRRRGREFLPVVDDLAAVGQTLPPVAVLALAVPVLGFGARPAVLALFLYSVLPILRNTVAGLEAVAPDLVETASALGMTPWQTLRQVELPLALPLIASGLRTSVVINIGTATVGAAIGAGGLGAPIIAGLVQHNPAFVLEGALPAAALALLADACLGLAEKTLQRG